MSVVKALAAMVKMPLNILQAFGVPERLGVEFGDVFYLPESHVDYYGETHARPAVVVRVQRAANGESAIVYLHYTTTKRVPPAMRLSLNASEGGLPKDCRLDVRCWKEITVADLLADCRKLGRLDGQRCADVEALMSRSHLPARVKRLPR